MSLKRVAGRMGLLQLAVVEDEAIRLSFSCAATA